jgi:mycothiol synthase
MRWERTGDHVDVALAGGLDAHDRTTVDAVTTAVQAVQAAQPGNPSLQLIADHQPAAPWPLPALVAAALDLQPSRELYQLRRPLPVADDDPGRSGAPPIALRPFALGRDEESWLEVNNAAFASHPSQGHQTRADLDRTLAEAWIDRDGFLVLDDPDRPGHLAGFCWTRIHPATAADPVLGEIYVIGVAPAHHGRRLGASLVLAGLDHLAWRGVATGMLYVEGDNAPARRLYERLGFHTHLIRRIDA